MDPLSDRLLRSHLTPGSFGTPFRFFGVTGSTNDDARAWARNGAPHGAAVYADAQTRGRGRRGRGWDGGAHLSILASYVVQTHPSRDRLGLLACAISVAVVRAVREETGLVAELKWPNDLLLAGRKAAGLLLESDDAGFVVAGVGLNVNQRVADLPAESRIPATSIRMETGRPWDRAALLARIGAQIDLSLAEMDRHPRRLIATREEMETTLGKLIEASAHGRVVRGVVTGVLPDGSLRLRGDGAEMRLAWGELSHVTAAEGAAPPNGRSVPDRAPIEESDASAREGPPRERGGGAGWKEN